LRRTAQVIVVGSVMFTFISFWRTAAVVLCDLASTAYYIGGIVEQAIGPAAPWFILAVMVFQLRRALVYIESCASSCAGGVYRVVRTAMGGFMGKLAVARPDLRLHPDRPDLERHRRPISDEPRARNLRALCRRPARSRHDRRRQELGGRRLCESPSPSTSIGKNVKGIHESSEKAFQDHEMDDRDGGVIWSGAA